MMMSIYGWSVSYMKEASKIFVATKKRDEILWDYDALNRAGYVQ
jgi:hypothetical protein